MKTQPGIAQMKQWTGSTKGINQGKAKHDEAWNPETPKIEHEISKSNHVKHDEASRHESVHQFYFSICCGSSKSPSPLICDLTFRYNNGVMNLLFEIYSQPLMVPKMLEKLKLAEKHGFDLNKELQADEHGYEANDLDSPYILSTITPRLWPFMRHTITCVRHSSIRTLKRLLEVGYKSSMDSTASRFWSASVLGDALQIVFQNLLLESNEEFIQSSVRVWRLLLQCPVLVLEGAASSCFSSWMQLASTSYGSPLDSTKMFWPVALPRKVHPELLQK